MTKLLLLLGALATPAPSTPARAPTVKAAKRAKILVDQRTVDRFVAHPERLRKDLKVRFERRRGGRALVVWRVRKGGTFYTFGLRKGDVIHRIAGRRIGSLTDGMLALGSFLSSQSAEVELRRRGRPVRIRAEII